MNTLTSIQVHIICSCIIKLKIETHLQQMQVRR